MKAIVVALFIALYLTIGIAFIRLGVETAIPQLIAEVTK